LSSGQDVSATPIIDNFSQTVIYTAGTSGGLIELFSVPIKGGVAKKINGPLVSGGTVVDSLGVLYPQINSKSTHVVYEATANVVGVTELFSTILKY